MSTIKWRLSRALSRRKQGFTVLGGLAEFERALIIARTGDGRVRAKARGVRFGRPPALPATNGRKPSSDLRKALRRPISRGPTV